MVITQKMVFKTIMDQANYRLQIKRELKSNGMQLTGEMKNLPTEKLLELKQSIGNI